MHVCSCAIKPACQSNEVGRRSLREDDKLTTQFPLAATGTPFSVAAGRLSFTYGLSGPAVSIDTACSSALVGTHMAMQHLNESLGDALSAGVNLMLAEGTTNAAQAAGEQ